MKRVYLILTLFMTSFFLLSSNVSADVVNFQVNESDLQLINDEFFKCRELAIEYGNQNNKNYMITYEEYNSNSYYHIYFFDKETANAFFQYWSYTNRFRFNFNTGYESYYFINNSLKRKASGSGFTYFIDNGNYISYIMYLDTSYDNINYLSTGDGFTINYNGLNYNIIKDSHVPSLYEIYQDYQPSQVDPKTEIVTNFYVLIIDKIKLLTNYIATDYIILSAIVIFIFVAVIGLVRRLK